MASEKIGYNVFPALPITGPITSVAFGMDTATTGANVILNGTSFSARVQVSNAIVRGGPAHLFIPPDASFDTAATLNAASPPTQVPGPFRYIRIVLDSGTLTGANIEETHGIAQSLDLNAATLAGQTAGAAAGTVAGAAAAGIPTAAIANTLLSQLATRGPADGPQFVGGSRWLWAATDTSNTGVAAFGGGYWVPELALPVVTPEMYGAKGDGVTFDDVAFRRMLAAYSSAAGLTIQLAAKTYRLKNTLWITRPHQIFGPSRASCVLLWDNSVDTDFAVYPFRAGMIVAHWSLFNPAAIGLTGTGPNPLVIPTLPAGSVGTDGTRARLGGFTLRCTTPPAGATGLILNGVAYVDNVLCRGWSRYGGHILADVDSNYGAGYTVGGNANFSTVINSEAFQNGSGWVLEGKDTNGAGFIGTLSNANANYGFYDDSLIGGTFSRCETDGNYIGFGHNTARPCTPVFSDCYAEPNQAGGGYAGNRRAQVLTPRGDTSGAASMATLGSIVTQGWWAPSGVSMSGSRNAADAISVTGTSDPNYPFSVFAPNPNGFKFRAANSLTVWDYRPGSTADSVAFGPAAQPDALTIKPNGRAAVPAGMEFGLGYLKPLQFGGTVFLWCEAATGRLRLKIGSAPTTDADGQLLTLG